MHHHRKMWWVVPTSFANYFMSWIWSSNDFSAHYSFRSLIDFIFSVQYFLYKTNLVAHIHCMFLIGTWFRKNPKFI
jgi:hypothetical protein